MSANTQPDWWQPNTAELLRSERWHLSCLDDGGLIVHTEGDIVCHPDPNHEPGDPADAVRFNLIASAPDLLRALKAAIAFIDANVADPDITDEMARAWIALQDAKPHEAISKAEAASC